MKTLVGLNTDDLKEVCKTFGQPEFRAKQLYDWLYHKGVSSFEAMRNMPAVFIEQLKSEYTIERLQIKIAQNSSDGTQKWLLRFPDGNEAECVHIPETTRGTLCVSSQIGCTLTCKFCHTGTQTLVRNLSAGEIIGQVMTARDVFGEWPTPEGNRHVSNIVLMGMGEPLYNFENVSKAFKIIMDPKGLWFSRHKITLSTSGVVPMIDACAKDLRVNLAVSLHAVRNELRDHLVPLNKKYPLEELIETLRRYPEQSGTDRITFEYVMLKDVNDSLADAKELARLIKGIPAKINLIPFNPWPGSNFERSTDSQIRKFAQTLDNAGYFAPVRTPRGEDILAACGQLKSESERQSKSRLKA